MKNIQLLSILFLLFIVSISASAITVENLYQVQIPVQDPANSNANRDLRTALRAVMVKLTGKRDVESVHGVNQILDKANDFVAQYEYRQVIKDAAGETPTETQVEHSLWVRFDQRNLDQAVQDFSVPLWSQERPLTLLWLVIDDGAGFSRFVNNDDDPAIMRALQQLADQRGISLATTLNDLTDAANLKPADVVGGFSEVIRMASERYQADVILTGVLRRASMEQWTAQWTSMINSSADTSSANADSIGPLLAAGIHSHSDMLAGRYAQQNAYGAVAAVQINVHDINDFDDYMRSLSYLESLNFITRVSVARLQPQQVTFDLQIQGGLDSLNQSLIFGSVIKPDSTTAHYRLIP